MDYLCLFSGLSENNLYTFYWYFLFTMGTQGKSALYIVWIINVSQFCGNEHFSLRNFFIVRLNIFRTYKKSMFLWNVKDITLFWSSDFKLRVNISGDNLGKSVLTNGLLHWWFPRDWQSTRSVLMIGFNKIDLSGFV